MPEEPSHTAAFEAFEATAWERRATAYAEFFPRLTGRTIDALLDAAHLGSGTRVLDVATGPGHVAEAAAARGSAVVGIDIAEAMVEIARRRCPAIEFHQGDATTFRSRRPRSTRLSATSPSSTSAGPRGPSPSSPGSWHRAAAWR